MTKQRLTSNSKRNLQAAEEITIICNKTTKSCIVTVRVNGRGTACWGSTDIVNYPSAMHAMRAIRKVNTTAPVIIETR